MSHMKSNTNKHAVWTGLLLCSAVAAYAVPVTFQVDMGQQPAFDPVNNTVELRGPFNSWGSGSSTYLTNVPTTTIYTNTVNITNTAGSWVQYKFFVGYNGTLNWEQLGGWHPDGNRAFQVPSTALTLPVAYYADAGPGGTSVEVTFQINMSAQIGIGNFNPGGGDLIQAMGAFNGAWDTVVLSEDAARPGIYTNSYVEVTRPPGTLIEYKFAINKGGGLYYESLSTANYPDNPPNRAFILTPDPMTLPVVFYSDASGLPIKAGIYFQLDMSSQILVNAFDPVNDIASVRGDEMGWGDPPGEGLQLFEDAARPGIYTNTWLSASYLTGQAFNYKYSYFRNGGTIWEGGGNKSVSFTGLEPTNPDGYHMITLGPTLFDNWQANTNDYLPADTLVTFSISMTNAQSYEGFSPLIIFDKTMGVSVNGNWIPWYGWTPPAPTQYAFTNGTSGDWIYSQTILVPKGSEVQLVYKYCIDDNLGSSLDNEAGNATNHVRYVRATGSYTLPMDTWQVPYEEPSIGPLTIGAPSGGTVPVSWLGHPGAYLQTSTDLSNPSGWVTHYDSAGSGSPSGIYSTNYPMSGSAIFFRVIKPGSP